MNILNDHPIIIKVTNNSDEPKNFKLFGGDIFGSEKNFGSDDGVSIEVEYYGMNYEELLKYISDKQVKVGLIYISTPIIEDADDFIYVINNEYYRKYDVRIKYNVYGRLSTRMAVRLYEQGKQLFINGNSYIASTVAPKTTLKYEFYGEGKKIAELEVEMNDIDDDIMNMGMLD